MQVELTAIFSSAPEGGVIAFVEKLPGATTQGETLDDVRANLREAAELVIQASRALVEEELAGAEVIRKPLRVTAW